MTTQIFSCRMHHQISTQGQRPLQRGGAVGVVDYHPNLGIIVFSQRTDRCNIHHPHIGVNRRFKIQHSGIFAEIGLNISMVSKVGIADIYTKFFKAVLHKRKGAAVESFIHQ